MFGSGRDRGFLFGADDFLTERGDSIEASISSGILSYKG